MDSAIETRESKAVRLIIGMVQRAERDLKQFREELEKSPAVALRKSDSAFSAAMVIEVGASVTQYLECDDTTVAGAIDELQALINFHALRPVQSTSVSVNLLESAKQSARAEVLEKLQNLR